MAPLRSRTVTGAMTRVARAVSLASASGGVGWICVSGRGAMGPSGACAKAAVAEKERPTRQARRDLAAVSIAKTKSPPGRGVWAGAWTLIEGPNFIQQQPTGSRPLLPPLWHLPR